MKRTFLLFLSSISHLSVSSVLFAVPYPAITIVPVADLVNDSLQKTNFSDTLITRYNALPLCSQKATDCLRLQQTLLHERVTIHEEKGEEVKITIANLFFQTHNDTTKNCMYWSLKKNFMPLSTLINKKINLNDLPTSLQYNTPSDEPVPKQQIVTLLLPHYDPITKRTFSAGTRFVIAKKNTRSFLVYVLHQTGSTINTMEIPQKKALLNKKQSKDEQIKVCVAILKAWAHQHQGFIPYVWGGCSFTHCCIQEPYSLSPSSYYGNIYQRDSYNNSIPKTGFDCTGLLARAAQAAGMPYYFKNSTTILKNLKPRGINDTLENGDVIWIPGHIMIISDVEKELIIEARSYDHGWGKVHEAPISAIFNNIPTLKSLLVMCNTQQPLERINREGVVAQKITLCKILNIRSLWD